MTDPSAPDLPRLVERQRAFFAQGETRSLDGRRECLRRLQEGLMKREEEFLAALVRDLGKPEIEGFLAEYHFLLQELKLVQGSLASWLRPRRAGSPFYFWPCRNRIERVPHGCALVLAPWNYPLQLALSPLIAAIAAGNTVVLKPSEHAPASTAFLADLLSEVFPPEYVSVVPGGPAISHSLLEEPFDFLFFTGSNEVGKVVARKAAEHLTPHILELGGKCPCVVDESADLAITARRILAGKLFNAGQTCFAPDFVAVHESVHEELVREMKELLESLPWEKEMAKIVNAHQFARLEGLATGEVIQKGQDDAGALHFAPRLLPSARWEDPVMQEEIFGPILPIVPFSDQEQLIERLRALSTPLALYCFSREEDFIQTLLDRVQSGSVCLNDVGKQATNLALPFGGSGASGHGRYRGKAGVLAMTQERSVTRRYFFKDVFELLPPRNERAASLRKWLK